MKSQMKHDQAKSTWEQIKERAKKPWIELTVDDFKKVGGSMDKFYDAIPEKDQQYPMLRKGCRSQNVVCRTAHLKKPIS